MGPRKKCCGRSPDHLAVIFDARRKIRRALVANGYLEERGGERR